MTQLRERFGRLYAGVVYDAMRFDLHHRHPFVVDHRIKPAWPLPAQHVLFGPTFTCRGERVQDEQHLDDSVRIRMFEEFTPGVVQVIDTGGDDTVAHFGDISGKLASKFGAAGAIIDGFTRDLRRIEEDRFPLFCRGVQPIDAFGRWQIVEYQIDITLSGIEGPVRVSPGDYVFGDPDGVIVIPRDRAEDVCEFAERRLAQEDTVRMELNGSDDVQELYDRIGRW